MHLRKLCLILSVLSLPAVLPAQIIGPGGGYPGGGYPGGGYPGQYPGGGVGIPMPGRRHKTKDAQTSDKLVSYTGVIQEQNEGTWSLRLEDGRNIEVKVSSRTKFYKASAAATASDFHSGDQVTVESSEDNQHLYTAVNVRLEQASARRASERSEAVDDPDRPVLRRGGPAKRRTEEEPADVSQVADASGGRPSLRLDDPHSVERLPEPVIGFGDAFLDKAYEAGMSFTEGLPNYVCQEFVARYQSETRVPSWHAIDIVSYDLVYQDGHEDYRNTKINGKAVAAGQDQKTGSWSSGEFGTILRGLFALGRSAHFHFVKESTIGRRTARVYEFAVSKQDSRWHVMSGSQAIDPAYKGTVWIDKSNARVLRIEMQAVSLPQEFPLDTVESSLDYDYLRLDASQEFLLPVKAETLSCERGTFYCGRNGIDFRNYHKYSSDAVITFDK